MVDDSTAALHNAGLLSNPTGGVSFGSGAFPAATQAAFGLGGTGVGYGGTATGGSISVPASFFSGATQQAAAAAPAGGAADYTPILLIGGLLLVGLLVVMAMGSRHERHRR